MVQESYCKALKIITLGVHMQGHGQIVVFSSVYITIEVSLFSQKDILVLVLAWIIFTQAIFFSLVHYTSKQSFTLENILFIEQCHSNWNHTFFSKLEENTKKDFISHCEYEHFYSWEK